MPAPRTRRSASALRPRKSRPSKTISPEATLPGDGINPRTARAVIDLPQPVSPTSPTVSPGHTLRSSLSTTRLTCPLDANSIVSPRMLRTGSDTGSAMHAWIQRVAETVAEKIEADDHQRDCQTRYGGDVNG